MKKRKPIHVSLYFLLAFVTFASCEPNEKSTQAEQLAEEVMAIHDEVMPQMSEIFYLKDSLNSYLNQWEESGEGDSTKAASFKDAAKALESADKMMMNWMRNYKIPEEGDNSPETIVYLETEKGKVEKMRDAVMGSLETSKKLLADELQ